MPQRKVRRKVRREDDLQRALVRFLQGPPERWLFNYGQGRYVGLRRRDSDRNPILPAEMFLRDKHAGEDFRVILGDGATLTTEKTGGRPRPSDPS